MTKVVPLEQILKALPDIDIVASAANGNEAVELAHTLSPQVIVIDLDTRAQDGLDAIRTLRARGCGATIVAVSKYDSPCDRSHAEAAGAQHFLSKLQNPEGLACIIRDLPRNGAQTS